MAGITVGGLGSGLDVTAIVQQLVQAEGAPQQIRLDRREAQIQTELSGLGFLKTAASELQTGIAGLTNLSDFSTTSATSSDSTVLTVSSGSAAVPGTYSLEVQQLATSQKLTSSAFTNKSDIIGTGELTFEFGTASGPFALNTDKTAQTVDLSGTDGSLTAIRDAVNDANIGVNATIINDGSGFKLSFSVSDTGANNSLRITADDDDLGDTDTSGLSQLAFDPDAGVGSGQNMTQTVAAANSTFVLDGTTINTASNTLTDTIEGLTITMKAADTGNAKTITVSRGTSVGQSEVETFITAYNAFNATLRTLSSFDQDTGETGILFGDVTLRGMLNFVSSMVATPVDELNSEYNSLASIGLKSDSEGNLSLDSTIFSTATTAQPDIVARLFSDFGKTTDSNVEFVSATTSAEADDYAINITSVATQGTAVGGAAANLTITDGVNDTIQFTVDDKVVTVDLNAGTYANAAALAAEVQTRINSNEFLQADGISVTVSESSGTLSVTSNSYGSNSTVTVDSGNGATDLMGAVPISTGGADMVGTINGQTGTTDGLELSADGITIKVNGSATGNRGFINYTKGQANTLSEYLDTIIDSSTGIIPGREDSLNAQVEEITEDRADLARRMEILQARLTQQFASLDSLLTGFQTTGNFLTSALANLPKPGGN